MAVSLSWLVLSCIGTLPFLLSGSITHLLMHFLKQHQDLQQPELQYSSDVESLPYSILFWRSFTHWIGGLGIVVFVIIILPTLGMTASQLLPMESSLKEKIHPKTKAVGLRLLYVYLGLTVARNDPAQSR